jgi:hypothetical protein
MNENLSSKTVRTTAEWLTILLFLALAALPTLDMVCHLDRAPAPLENRTPATWPRFESLAEIRSFINGVECYFNDHFGFRNQLVSWNNHWKGRLFADASTRDALVGRDGWLYFWGSRMLAHWNREEVMSEADLARWQQLLEWKRDWLAARGIRYIFVVPPDKQSIYPEHLPQWMPPSAKPSKTQQLTEYMRTHSSVRVLDLRPSLLEARKLRPCYFSTDSH